MCGKSPRPGRGVVLAVVFIVSFGTSTDEVRGAATLTVREQINAEYGRELVSFRFEAKKKACVPQSVELAGPGGPVAAQLSDIEYWSEKQEFVKSARLWFVVNELKPLTTAVYTLSYGTAKAAGVPGDLQVTSGKDGVELGTSLVGVRLLLGGDKYPEPAAAKDVPGPLRAMRLGKGNWAGGSSLTGDAKVREWSSRITDSGPVFARVAITYTFADDNTLELAATLIAGDSAVRWDMAVRDDRPELAVEFRLPPVPGVKQALMPKGYGQWAKSDRVQPIAPSAEPFSFLSPNTSLTNIFPDCPNAICLAGEGGVELQLRSRDPGAWADPVAPFTYGGYEAWHLDMIQKSWEVWKRKRIAVSYTADGTTTLRASLTKGRRKWSVSAGKPLVGDQLDRVKDLILDWPVAGAPHPRLFLDRHDLQDAWNRATGDPQLAKQLAAGSPAIALLLAPADKRTKAEQDRVVGMLRSQLDKLGNFDVMRHSIATAALYDTLIDSDLISPQEKTLFRAQMAYLAYVLADPMCWSIERGYHSGNPNMSCSYVLSLGVAACVLSDHPMARTWADYATTWMDRWLTEEVGSNGEWLPEGSHYGYVSLAPMLSYAIAAQRAGYRDFSDDPRLKKLVLYFAKYQTPRDVQRRNARVTPAFGRGTSGDTLGVFGLAARLFAKSDPELSRQMQWLWAENGYPLEVGDGRLGGYEPYYMDRRLPAEQPKWGSELFPNLGALLRAAFATPYESYVNFIACAQSLHNLDIWTPGIGGIAQWFGRGMPLSTCFTFGTGYAERHELLRDGVLLARNWGAADDPKGPFGYYTETRFCKFAALPQADYVCSSFVITKPDDRDWFPDKLPAYPRLTPAKEARLDWMRQVLFLKDADPAGPAYLVVRDTTRGGQPTAWQFWTLSEKLGSADQAKDVAAFLADKPGPTIRPARQLPPGQRYTAIGQFGVDIEYFVASPADTPRHTLRYGGTWAGVPEYQDLLHLQLPADGTYHVVLFPRPRTEAAPTFSTVADGKVIEVAGQFGSDYALLSLDGANAAFEGIVLRGTAAAVQVRPDATTLSLGAAGEVRWKDYGLAAPAAGSLAIAADSLTLCTDGPGGEYELTAPEGWKVRETTRDVRLRLVDGRHRLLVPEGVARVSLVKRR